MVPSGDPSEPSDPGVAAYTFRRAQSAGRTCRSTIVRSCSTLAEGGRRPERSGSKQLRSSYPDPLPASARGRNQWMSVSTCRLSSCRTGIQFGASSTASPESGSSIARAPRSATVEPVIGTGGSTTCAEVVLIKSRTVWAGVVGCRESTSSRRSRCRCSGRSGCGRCVIR